MGMIQVAKDTFYQILRDRIASANPARTIVIRGLLRPAVLTVENELPGAGLEAILPAEAFCLRWTTLAFESQSTGPLVTLGCEIHYTSEGSTGAAGMDRGRGLTALDADLLAALLTLPMSTPAVSVVEVPGGGASGITPLGWKVFWGVPRPQATVMKAERLQRIVEVEVFCYGQ